MSFGRKLLSSVLSQEIKPVLKSVKVPKCAGAEAKRIQKSRIATFVFKPTGLQIPVRAIFPYCSLI